MEKRPTFDENRLKLHELLHVFDGFRYTPNLRPVSFSSSPGPRTAETHLVGINHDLIPIIIPQHIPYRLQPRPIRLNARPNLELEHSKTLGDRLLQHLLHLVATKRQPPRTRRIRRHGLVLQRLPQPLLLTLLRLLQHLQRFLGRDNVGDIPEVDAPHHLLRRHVAHDAPDGLVHNLAPEIPHGVEHAGHGEVRHGLLGADPPILRVGDHVPPGLAHVSCELGHGLVDDAARKDVEGHADQFAAAAVAEGLCISSWLDGRY
jgi:hypothetical protein